MRTPLKFAGLTLAAAAVVVCAALLIVPGLASAPGGGAEDTGGKIEPAPHSPAVDLPLLVATPQPAVAAEPALPSPAVAGEPAQIEPAKQNPSPAPAPTPPTKPAESRSDPNGSVSSPAMPFDPGYWTPERMANAKPMPMPTVPGR